jgi:SAM-dependent methyltransferase
MDGREMSIADDSFDQVLAGFIGWDNYFDFDKLQYRITTDDPMIQEISRVLRPGGKFGLSTWLVQKDLDWMYNFLTRQSISCKTNYSAENIAGWKIIMETGKFSQLEFVSKSVEFTYESKDAWWKEMRDYDWSLEKDDENLITDSIREQAFNEIQSHLTSEGGVKFEREALFVIGTNGH